MRPTSLAIRPQVKDVDWFIDQLLNISPNNLRLLWVPYLSDTTTTRQKNDGRIFTHSSPGAIITNGNFETDTSTWALNGAGVQSQTRITTDSKFGIACNEIVTDGAVGGQGLIINGVANAVAVSVSTSYTLSAYVKSISGSVTLLIGIDWYTSGDVYISTNSDTPTFSLDWARYTITATSPSNAAKAVVFLRINPATAATYRVDGIRFESGSSADNFGLTSSLQKNGILITFDGVTDSISTPDTSNLSFINAAFSIVTLANVTDTAAYRAILSKYNDTGTAREWYYRITDLDKLELLLHDESAAVSASRATDAAITQGIIKLFTATYTALSAGASAANDITLYDNITAIASTATNNAAFVATEDLTALVRIGSYSNGATPAQLMSGSMGFVALFSIALSLTQIIAIRNLCREYYGLALN